MANGRVQTTGDRPVDLRALGQRFSELRLVRPEAVGQMQRSLSHNGQLTPLAIWVTDTHELEVVDGFKRLQAARKLGWAELRVREIGLYGAPQAKLAVALLNAGGSLSELEEAWLVQSLYRKDLLSQVQIGRLWGRHKSWVCRRLALAEGLEETVMADVRLGLLAARTAAEIARLPRGNQPKVCELAIRRGMTCAQVSRLVGDVLKCPDAVSIDQYLAQQYQKPESKADKHTGRRRGPVQQALMDIGQVVRLCARLQGALPNSATWLSSDVGRDLVLDAVTDLLPVCKALSNTLQKLLTQHRPPQGSLLDQGQVR